MGKFIIICYSFLKAFFCSPPHSKLCHFFNNFGKAEVIDARLGNDLLMYEALPKKLFNSLMVDGGFMVAIAVAFAGSTSIPLLWTRNLRNFLAKTPKAHFNGFIFSLKSLHCSSTFLRILT